MLNDGMRKRGPVGVLLAAIARALERHAFAAVAEAVERVVGEELHVAGAGCHDGDPRPRMVPDSRAEV